MKTSKYRLETFTDGVIAIIITIMVLSIPLPASFQWNELMKFVSSLSIYLLSFLVVGAFWNQHHFAFSFIDKVSQKIIATTIFFLFFLSLIPLFTKWVIENQGSLIPVIGFDIVYLMVSFFYVLSFRMIMEESNHEKIKEMRENIKNQKKLRPHFSWMPVLGLLLIISLVVGTSIIIPRIATIVLMGIPIASSVLNLFISERDKRSIPAKD